MAVPALLSRLRSVASSALLTATVTLTGCGDDGVGANSAKVTSGAQSDDEAPVSQPKEDLAKKPKISHEPGTGAVETRAAFSVPGNAKEGKKIAKKKCRTCHKIDGKGLAVGPAMDKMYRRFLDARMEAYPMHVAALSEKHKAVYDVRKKDIDEIVATQAIDERLYKWLNHYIRQPTFDRPACKMKPVVLTDKQLENVIAFLFSLPK